jgi:hypothetical protein
MQTRTTREMARVIELAPDHRDPQAAQLPLRRISTRRTGSRSDMRLDW